MNILNKKIIPIILAVLIAMSSFTAFIAFADDTSWHYDYDTSTLYITGVGAMNDYQDVISSPWHTYDQLVENIVVEEGVTHLGDYSFSGFIYLKSISFPDSLTSIGANSLYNCTMLKEITLGPNITSIADTSFAMNGSNYKSDFVVNVEPASYSLYYIITQIRNGRSINLNCENINTGTYHTQLVAGATAYYPFTPKHNCTVNIYTSGKYDTIGEILNSQLQSVSYDDDGGSGVNFSITYSLNAGEQYYFSAYYFSPSRPCEFDFTFDITAFTYSLTAYAMSDPSGTQSNIKITDLLVNGQPIGEGIELDFDTPTADVELTLNGATQTITVSAVSEDIIVLNPLDINNDGYINAKDYAALYKSSSPYLSLYHNFINYKFVRYTNTVRAINNRPYFYSKNCHIKN